MSLVAQYQELSRSTEDDSDNVTRRGVPGRADLETTDARGVEAHVSVSTV